MTLIDVHSHVQFAAYDADRDEVMERARSADTLMINVGTQYDTSKAAVELANKYPDIAWATIGLHPVHTSASYHDAKEINPDDPKTKGFTSRGEQFDYDKYLALGRDDKVVAIGECGLDYYRLTDETKAKQHETFIKQIELANELDKPLMLHIRDGFDKLTTSAYDDALMLLKKHAKVKGDCHFFAGDWNIAKQFLNLGFMLSFTGVLTFTHDYDDVVKNTPLDMIMTETDSPYITPVPLRGKRNEPVNVKYVVARIAEIKGLDVVQVAEQVMKNAKRVFNI